MSISSSAPARLDFKHRRGATFSRVLIVTDGDGNPVDFTGYAGDMAMKTSPESNAKAATFAVTFGAGKIYLDASATEMTKDPRSYDYDLKLTNASSEIAYWVAGYVILEGNIT